MGAPTAPETVRRPTSRSRWRRPLKRRRHGMPRKRRSRPDRLAAPLTAAALAAAVNVSHVPALAALWGRFSARTTRFCRAQRYMCINVFGLQAWQMQGRWSPASPAVREKPPARSVRRRKVSRPTAAQSGACGCGTGDACTCPGATKVCVASGDAVVYAGDGGSDAGSVCLTCGQPGTDGQSVWRRQTVTSSQRRCAP